MPLQGLLVELALAADHARHGAGIRFVAGKQHAIDLALDELFDRAERLVVLGGDQRDRLAGDQEVDVRPIDTEDDTLRQQFVLSKNDARRTYYAGTTQGALAITGYTINALFAAYPLNNKPAVTTLYYGQVRCATC